MKVKITIENGRSKIVLKPENTFEKRMVEDMHDDKKAQDINIDIEADYKMHGFEDHRIVIDVVDEK